MKKQTKLTKKELLSNLYQSITSEQIATDFYLYISRITQNPKVKKAFIKFANIEAKRHKRLLNRRLKLLTGSYFRPNFKALSARIRVFKFSLIGVLKIAKEAERRAFNFYKRATNKDTGHKQMYASLVKEEQEHWRLIDSLRRSVKEREYYSQQRCLVLIARLKQAWR